MLHIWAQNGSIAQNEFFFFRKTVNIINFQVPLDPIHFAKFQKNPYSGSKVMSARHF